MAVSEKQRKENMKMMSIYLALVTGVIAAYILGYGCSMMEIEFFLLQVRRFLVFYLGVDLVL